MDGLDAAFSSLGVIVAGVLTVVYSLTGKKKWSSMGAACAALPITIVAQHIWYASTPWGVRATHGASVTILLAIALLLYMGGRYGNKRMVAIAQGLNWTAFVLAYTLPLVAYLGTAFKAKSPMVLAAITVVVVLLIVAGFIVATVVRLLRRKPRPPQTGNGQPPNAPVAPASGGRPPQHRRVPTATPQVRSRS